MHFALFQRKAVDAKENNKYKDKNEKRKKERKEIKERKKEAM